MTSVEDAMKNISQVILLSTSCLIWYGADNICASVNVFSGIPKSGTHNTQHTTHNTLPMKLLPCRLHTHGVSRKVRRGLSHLLKVRCLHCACRKNQTVIFVLPLSVLLPTRGRVRGRSSVMTKRREMETAIPAVSRIMIPRRNNVRQLDMA